MPGRDGKPFDEPGDENLIAHSSEQVVEYLADFDEAGRRAIAAAAKRRALAFHTRIGGRWKSRATSPRRKGATRAPQSSQRQRWRPHERQPVTVNGAWAGGHGMLVSTASRGDASVTSSPAMGAKSGEGCTCFVLPD